MVKGLDLFRDHFADYSDSYVLIGGAACNMHEDIADQEPRATKDLDIVLVVEALSADFVRAFWAFVHEGGYISRQRGEDKHELTTGTREALLERREAHTLTLKCVNFVNFVNFL